MRRSRNIFDAKWNSNVTSYPTRCDVSILLVQLLGYHNTSCTFNFSYGSIGYCFILFSNIKLTTTKSVAHAATGTSKQLLDFTLNSCKVNILVSSHWSSLFIPPKNFRKPLFFLNKNKIYLWYEKSPFA